MLLVVVAAANQVDKTDHQLGVQQIMRHAHRQPVQEVPRQLKPLVTSSAYHRNQMVMLDRVRVRQRQEDLQARVNVVALQTLRLHQQVVTRARVQRMQMAVQETVRPQCSVICLVDLQPVTEAQQLKVVRAQQQVVRDLHQVVDRAQRVARLR